MPDAWIALDPCLPTADADALVSCIRTMGPLPMYVSAPVESGIGAGLVRRHDALMHYVKSRFAAGAVESMQDMTARTNLFRGVLAEGTATHVDGVDELLYRHEPFLEAARRLTGLPLVVPDMLYANVLLAGQDFAVHTDTPEYRGLSKAEVPEWFLVVMHHSGLFEDWRIRIAGGVTFFHPPEEGGAFLLYETGPTGPVTRVEPRHDTSVMLDADALFHGVERVGGPEAPAPPVKPGMTLHPVGETGWEVRDGDLPVTRYAPGETRLSIQWKAHCFADEQARDTFLAHTDDLSAEVALDRLVDDLRARGTLTGDRPDDTALGLLLIETYIPFPTA